MAADRHSRAVTTEHLLRAAAQNHRAWFRRHVRHTGGSIEKLGRADLMIASGHGTIAFTGGVDDADAVAAWIRAAKLRSAAWWSLGPNDRIGTALVARGFGWGWEPHWMARGLDSLPSDATVEVDEHGASGPYSDDLPYAPAGSSPPATFTLGVRADGVTVGRVAVNPWRGIAGIYSMGVAESHRRRGLGRALTLAACRAAAARGCTHAVLNATEAGEQLYRAVGFQSLGWGQTWWWFPGPEPAPRQVALAEAIGNGETERLTELDPTEAELVTRFPGDTSPLRLAVLTNQLDMARAILERAPRLTQQRFEPFGGTLLHLAVESGRRSFVELALAHGVDPTTRDTAFNGTPAGWAARSGDRELVALLSDS